MMDGDEFFEMILINFMIWNLLIFLKKKSGLQAGV